MVGPLLGERRRAPSSRRNCNAETSEDRRRRNAKWGAPFLKSSLLLLLWSQRRKPPRPPRGKLYRRFFVFLPFLGCIPHLVRLLFGVHSSLSRVFGGRGIPSSPGLPPLSVGLRCISGAMRRRGSEVAGRHRIFAKVP